MVLSEAECRPRGVRSKEMQPDTGVNVPNATTQSWRDFVSLKCSCRYFDPSCGPVGKEVVWLMITIARSPVHSDPELLGGTLVFRGTRVPAQTLLDYVQDGYSVDGFLREFPSVDRQDAEEFLRLASQ
jgi:uncharacterized protein (DUF433 family)